MTSSYIHGVHPAEQTRLSLLNEILNRDCLAELRLNGGEKILDVGSGLGQFSRLMARASGLQVVGIERDPAQVDHALELAGMDSESSLIDVRRGDILDGFPLREDEWGTFDVVHARFVLEHVNDPLAVVRSMVRAAKAGGRIVLADDDHDVLRLYPDAPRTVALWRAYARSYENAGNDPFVGRKLISLLQEAGARPVRNSWVFFGAARGSQQFDAICDNFEGVLFGAARHLISSELANAEQIDVARMEFSSWRSFPDAAYWYAVCWGEGRKPHPTAPLEP